ncbi:hypothetical protein PROFUN_15568 [Planoprotostelium fungivorum]|uniref:Transmembrane protein n=1 Tax=Planoprotostelium fungivorum TaxID=1890364 RepID=A0A2P6MZ43_9EUKA|nr:hypothetical protein PROFUN_15568 [Planoprotostelium fungivorum]
MFKSALLLLAIVALGQTLYIQESTFDDDQCVNSTTSYIYREGRCQVTNAFITASTVQYCTSSTVKTTTYVSGSCSGTGATTEQNVNQCLTQTGDRKFSCISAFPYVANSAADTVTVTFGSTDCTGPVDFFAIRLNNNRNTSNCAISECSKNFDGRSSLSVCGSSPQISDYVSRFQGSASSVFVCVGLVFAALALF